MSSHTNSGTPQQIIQLMFDFNIFFVATELTMGSIRESFQRKYRSLFGSKRWRNGKQLDPSIISKSLSSPALNQQTGCKEQQATQDSFFGSSWGTLPATLRHRATDNGSNLRPMNTGISVPDLSKTLRNYKLALSEKVISKEVIGRTEPKDIAPLETAIDDQFLVAVSDLDNARKYLMIKTQKMESQPKLELGAINDQITPQPSPPDDRPEGLGQESHSSSASESGRGTCSSDHNKQETVVSPTVVYAEVIKKDKAKKSEYLKTKYPQLCTPANRAPMPVVAESESWVSDSTCTAEKSSKIRSSTKETSKKLSEKVHRVSTNSYKLPIYKANRQDDVSISSLDDDESLVVPKNQDLKYQMRQLRDMYGEVMLRLLWADRNHNFVAQILRGMRSSTHHRTNLRNSRRIFGSSSTVTSLASRTRRKLGTSHQRNPISSLEDSKWVKSLLTAIISANYVPAESKLWKTTSQRWRGAWHTCHQKFERMSAY